MHRHQHAERTKKVPTKLKENAKMASSSVQL